MSLAVGTRLGPYEVVARLGAGGMGVVYKATDTRLDRTVALKVLPEHVAADPELRQRFEREAKALAALSHPHICQIHDVGSQAPSTLSVAVDYLVMEHLEGETLAERLSKGALPLDQALQVASQIADALDKAHRTGIVHRDLKPGNIMLTRGSAGSAGSPHVARPGALHVKLLDFGLAKRQTVGAPGAAVLSAAQTVTVPLGAAGTPLTGAGTILGTVQYMAPEQLEGHEADARTDIFAFGAVVYEMVTGKKAFEGKSQASLIAAIMHGETPPLATLQLVTPPALDRLVATCLAKDPDDRWQTARDLLRELRWVAQASSTAGASASASERTHWGPRRWLASTLAVLVLLALGGAVGRFLGGGTEVAPTPVRLSFARPPGTAITNTGRPSIDISPDGSKVVFVANQRLYLRRLDGSQAEPIAGTESVNIHTPVFSPDAQWVAFQQEGELKRIPVGGGVPTTVFAGQMNSGGSWDDTSDRIVFANTEGVFRVPVSGGSPEKILSPVPSETIYGPRILPGGDHILLTVTTAIGNDRWDRAQIVAQSVTSGERTVLVEGGSDARYVPPGHLVYAIGTSLFAVSFDASTLRVTGAPVAIEQGIRRATTPGSNTAAANFSISRSGTLAFLPDTSLARATMAFADVNGGRVERLPIEGDVAEAPRVSPTRTQVAVRNRRDNAIWIHALSGAASPRRLTLEGDGRYPTWSPDGAWIAFYWRRAAGEGLYRQRADGSAPELLKPVQFARDKPVFWSRDGQSLFYVNDSGLWSVERGGASPRARLEGLAGESSFGPDVSLSPDGSWVAFHTVEGGTTVPFIQSLSDAGRKFAISTTGGSHPLWAPDGQRIFYVAGDSRRLMAVDVALQPTVVFGQPVVVLDAVVQPQTIGRNYDITPDGTRLLVLVPEDEGNAESPLVEVVQHWTEGLKQRVPID